jgi:Peptidase M15
MLSMFRAVASITCLLSLVTDQTLYAQGQPEGDEAFSRAAFEQWLAADPGRSAQFASFETFLDAQGVKDVVPTWQLLRTASSAIACNQSAFALAPEALWPNLVGTLKFAQREVIPVIGPLEAVSGYRPPELNACAGGAPRSAHAQYWALDFVPGPEISREEMIAKVCRAHEDHGRDFNIGLGFYTKLRFHLDSRSFRRWGPDSTRVTSPCWAALGLPVPEPVPSPETSPASPPAAGSVPVPVPVPVPGMLPPKPLR